MPEPASATESDATLLDGLRHAWQVRGYLVATEMASLIEIADRGIVRLQQATALGVAEGIERFRPYARHMPYCTTQHPRTGTDPEPGCNCGLDRALGRDQERK